VFKYSEQGRLINFPKTLVNTDFAQCKHYDIQHKIQDTLRKLTIAITALDAAFVILSIATEPIMVIVILQTVVIPSVVAPI
jgi:hypothetical protein